MAISYSAAGAGMLIGLVALQRAQGVYLDTAAQRANAIVEREGGSTHDLETLVAIMRSIEAPA
jgi:UDP-N-acetylenolpyruvoylglucosamine reductase